MTGHRLPEGGRIARDHRLRFRFAGRDLEGHPGDTLASALIAAGVPIVGRSFKYHRPRGVFSAGPEEPNALVQLGARPNLKATQVPLADGLVADAVNCWPGPRLDLGAAIGLFKRFLPAGFYYKTFMAPGWPFWEPMIRRAAGLGRVDPAVTAPVLPGHRRNLHADLLVVGGGPAGLATALAAGRAGKRVVLCEQDTALGGSLLGEAEVTIGGLSSPAWLAETEAALATLPNVRILRATTVFGAYDHGLHGAVERERILWKIRARRTVLATGAIERPIAFGEDDLPGVMLAGAVRSYLLRHAAAAGRRMVLFTNNDPAYRTALAWARAGLEVAAVVDARPQADGALVRQARQAGLRLLPGMVVDRAFGFRAVHGVVTRDASGREEAIPCDLVAVSGGWNPAVHLFAQPGGMLAWDEGLTAFLPGAPAPTAGDVRCAGAAAGRLALAAALADGHEAGGGTGAPPGGPTPEEAPLLPLWHAGGDPARSWVDRASDVTVADVMLAARENYASVEHFKRYTTGGMSPDQGKSSNVVALALLGRETGGRAPSEVGTTRFRPPFDPVPLSALAAEDSGKALRPLMHLPAHDRHAALGAVFEEYGGLMRPAYYPRAGEEREAAARREAASVRAGCGLFDASPLGKLLVQGPDAAIFLDRMFVQRLSNLAPGRLRYAVCCTEGGIVFDDGVVARLAEDSFLVGTTSGGATRVAEVFEDWLQCEWPHLQVFVTPVTHQWGVVTVAGPHARALLQAAGTDIALDAFPHMTLREGRLAGIPVRVMRVSFTGETSYEIAVPARRTPELWEALAAAGEATPFGVEALMILRIEKGYLHVGADTDGTTFPQDCGFGPAMAKRADDFVGKRSAALPEAIRAGRRRLVGLLPDTPDAVPNPGAHIIGSDGRSEGHVTSACWSPVLGRAVALAMVRDGDARIGEAVTLSDLGRTNTARLVATPFIDPAGERLRG
jgi:sarcosine oxidase subunit alpha